MLELQTPATTPADFSFLDNEGIYSKPSHEVSNEHLQAIYDDLDQPPKPTHDLIELMRKYGGLNNMLVTDFMAQIPPLDIFKDIDPVSYQREIRS